MIDVEVRPLTDRDAAAYWNLRLEGLEQEPASFAESAEEHHATTVELAGRPPARLRQADDGSFVLGRIPLRRTRRHGGFLPRKTSQGATQGQDLGRLREGELQAPVQRSSTALGALGSLVSA